MNSARRYLISTLTRPIRRLSPTPISSIRFQQPSFTSNRFRPSVAIRHSAAIVPIAITPSVSNELSTMQRESPQVPPSKLNILSDIPLLRAELMDSIAYADIKSFEEDSIQHIYSKLSKIYHYWFPFSLKYIISSFVKRCLIIVSGGALYFLLPSLLHIIFHSNNNFNPISIARAERIANSFLLQHDHLAWTVMGTSTLFLYLLLIFQQALYVAELVYSYGSKAPWDQSMHSAIQSFVIISPTEMNSDDYPLQVITDNDKEPQYVSAKSSTIPVGTTLTPRLFQQLQSHGTIQAYIEDWYRYVTIYSPPTVFQGKQSV